MKIRADMDLSQLVPLMGERVSLGGAQRIASLQEASDLRQLLVRDYPGMDTEDIEGARWDLYCCAVDPEQQT